MVTEAEKRNKTIIPNSSQASPCKSVIPQQLRCEGFYFVKLKGKSKIPLEKNWQKKRISYHEIEKHIRKGNNYGVLGGCDGLIVVDADSEVISEIVLKSLPETFTVKTSKGAHYYYFCDDIESKMVLRKDNQHFGDIIAKGSQVVGPNSIHPVSKQAYIVENDNEIKSISKKELLKAFSDFLYEGNEKNDPISPSAEEVIQKYGKPYYLSNEGTVTSLNQSFWAGVMMTENILLYEPAENVFYLYEEKTGLYTSVSDNVLKQRISERLLAVSRSNRISSLEKKRSITTLSSIISHLKGIAEQKQPFNHGKKDFIHLNNGVLRIHEDKSIDLVSFSPSFLSRNQSPIIFDAKAKCDRFLNELLYPAVKQEDAILIQKYAGLCLLGDNLIQRLLILGGEAGQGKSQLSIVLQELVGLQNVTELRTHLLAERFELYRYLKKTLLIGVDVPPKFLMQKGAYVLKGLTGGDCFDAEKKGSGDSFQMQGNYCIIITANSRLQINLEGDVNAWRRRLLIVDYNSVVPKKKIPHFGKLLIEQEGSGILNWSLKGLQMVWKDIETLGDIVLEEAQINRVKGLLAESDSLRQFLSEEVITHPYEDLTSNEIVEAYANYCPQKGWNPKPITSIKRELSGLMLELFGKTEACSIKRQQKNQRGFRGVTLKKEVGSEY
ncbi:MAG: bifunctional DNA primase/polymerase [Candidatus Theseobacter exili]|nr:bifunctional DNA primase/polymerase [Candidatus Theseobacter exili]